MANPKLENGYTRIAHELLEQITLAAFSAAEYKILFAIIRQTYGYQKKSAAISMMELSKCCGLHFTSVSRAMKKLISNKIVIEVSSPTFAKCREVAINKNYAEWLTVSADKTVSVHANERVSTDANETVSVHANPTYIKDKFKNNIKDRGGKKPPSLESVKGFCQKNNILAEVGQKFFDHYEAIGWVTTKGFDITGTWEVKLLEWNRSEIPERKPEKKKESSTAAYDIELVEKLLSKDD